MASADNAIQGRYYVRSTAEEHIITEVTETCSSGNELPTSSPNVALNKPVSLSSYYATSSPGSLMTDGSRVPSWPCACTTYEKYPEAVVDLGLPFAITAMYIVNRGDCCPERLHDLVIQVGDDMSNLKTIFNNTGAIGATCTVLFDKQQQGRYVKLYIEGTSFLTVCELEVYSSG
ncbi:fucolectin-like [Ruditapes philippinarum]|uniref:fucolectin-like n=1 Tax=Ruditapes philippinarum TaxID=129788 RepID=UPI00295C1C23|nr:fucolectin-like [Ruditapes philippinarum]